MPNFDETRQTAAGSVRVVIYTTNDYSSCSVAKIGDREVGYDDNTETIFFPSSLKITLDDPSRVLYDGAKVTNHRVEVTLNGSAYYDGAIDVNQTAYDDGELTTDIVVNDGSSILKTIKIKDNAGNSLDPLGYIGGDPGVKIRQIILDVFKQINSSVTLTTNQDWSFKRRTPYTDIYTFDQLWIPYSAYFDTFKPFGTLADLLKNFAQNFGCVAGMINRNQAYFQKRWKSSLSPVSLAGNVESFKRYSDLPKLDGVYVFQNQPAPTGFTQGMSTGTVLFEASGEFKSPDAVLRVDTWIGANTNINATSMIGTATADDAQGRAVNDLFAIEGVKDVAVDSDYGDIRRTIGRYHYNYRIAPREKYEAGLSGVSYSMLSVYSYSSKVLRPIKIADSVETNSTRMIAMDITA